MLLKLGVTAMPLRYAISFVLAYGVFLGAVQVLADFMKKSAVMPLHASVVRVILFRLAVWLQYRAPEARTFAQALEAMRAKEAPRK